MILAVANQKGGVGKTIVSTSLAFGFIRRYTKDPSFRLLLVDADPQHSIMLWSQARNIELPEQLSLIAMPSDKLYRDLPPLAKDYSVTIIDTPSNFKSGISRSAVVASSMAIIPCPPSIYDQGTSGETMDAIQLMRVHDPSLQAVFLINRTSANWSLGGDRAIKDLQAECARRNIEEGGFSFFKTHITERQQFNNAASKGLAIQEFDKEKLATAEFDNLITEIEERLAC